MLELWQQAGMLFLGGCGGMLIYLSVVAAWERMRPSEQPPDYVLTMIDPDGVPIRQEKLSARDAARIISELNHHRRLYQ